MDYKDFIKPGNKVAFIPKFDPWNWDVKPQIVTIGKYRPYYTDGSPDPTPEEYNEWCYVEIEEYIQDEKQISLELLHAIEWYDEPDENAIYDSEGWKVVGKVAEEVDDYEYYILERNGEQFVVEESDFDYERDLYDLSEEELEELRGEIYVGSIYLHHYNNSFGINPSFLMGIGDAYCDYLCERYGEDKARKKDTPKEFAWYVMNEC